MNENKSYLRKQFEKAEADFQKWRPWMKREARRDIETSERFDHKENANESD